jgi:hypothetical protein
MTQLTVRFEKELERAIRALAKRERISLNQAALRLMRKGAGLGDEVLRGDTVGDSLDDLIGTWSEKEAKELAEAVEIFEGIDDEVWGR